MAVIASVGNWLAGTRDTPLRATVLPGTVLAAALGVYAAFRIIVMTVAVGPAENCLLLDVAGMALAACLTGLRYAEVPPVLRPLLRGIGAVVLAQVAFDDISLLYAPTYVTAGQFGWFLAVGGVAAGVCGGLGLWRPSWLLPLFWHYVLFRHQLNIVSRIEVSETDYLSMLDVGTFAVVGTFVVAFAPRVLSLLRLEPDRSTGEIERLQTAAAVLIWSWAVGAHLGNYFISGWTKIRTGGSDPFFWLLHNPTQNSILIGLERGDNPLGAWPGLVQFSWDAVSALILPLNLFVLGTQISVPLAAMHRRLLMLYTVLFDVFHIAVYLTLGAAFFFWVAVNTFIFAGARRLPGKSFSPAAKLVLAAAIGLAHFGFYTSHLGWLDAAKLASPSVVAETKGGALVPVPSVYFGILSYSIAQTAMYIPDDHFEMRLGGNTYNVMDWRASRACSPQTVHHQNTGVDLATVERMILDTDAEMRRDPIVKKWNLFYLYPHHMVANPLMFGAFNGLSIDDIVGYRYVVDSVCLSLDNGHLVRDVRKHSEFKLDVPAR